MLLRTVLRCVSSLIQVFLVNLVIFSLLKISLSYEFHLLIKRFVMVQFSYLVLYILLRYLGKLNLAL